MNTIDKLVTGSIDMHVHISPDSLHDSRQNALQLAYSARDMGMRAILLKSREYNTVPLALLVSEIVPEVQVLGSLCLDNEAGGISPAAALSAARMGARVIWMPTLTSANSKARSEMRMNIRFPGSGQFALDSDGKLRDEVKEIIQIVKEYDIVLASGHLSPREVFAFIEEAQRCGLTKLLITHALQGALMDESLSAEEIVELAKSGVFIEHSFWQLMPTVLSSDPMKMVESMKATGAEQCIMTTDFGQNYNPTAPEGMRLFIATMLMKGLTEKEIELMVKTNPTRLLGLD